MKKHIPNFITLLNLFSGFTAIVFAANHNMGGMTSTPAKPTAMAHKAVFL